jgi:DNA-binding response OmpR family regulator
MASSSASVGCGVERALPHEITRILVVDDDQDLRRMVALALADEGYEVRAVPDGRAALALLETWRPRVIVLDLMMPVLDGWGFRARQLATPGAADVPVIVLSAARDLRVEVLRPAAVVPKPFNLESFLETVADVAR